MADTPKNNHWQRVVLSPTGVTPGTYDRAKVTVNDEGRIVNISSNAASSAAVVGTIGDLPTVSGGTPANGEIAVVLNDGSGNEQIYVNNSSNVDLGAPLNRWRLVASTDFITPPFDFRQSTIGTAANQTISFPIQDTGIIKEIAVVITTSYSGGATISIQDNAGFVYMQTSEINPQLEGIYKTDLSGNLADIQTNSAPGEGQMRAIVGGAPSVGAGVVFITFVQP